MAPAEPGRTGLLFSGFLALLRRRGFIIGVDHHLRLQALLNSLDSRCRPEDLKYLLCPIFAVNARQQRQFYHAFDAYFQPLAVSAAPEAAGQAAAKREDTEPAAELPAPPKWQYVLLGILLLILTGLLAHRLAKPADIEQKPTAAAAQPGRDLTAKPTGEDVDPGQKPVGEAGPPETEEPEDQPGPRPNFFRQYRYLFRCLGLLAPFMIFLLMEGYKYQRRRLILVRQRGKKPPFVWPIRVDTPEPGPVKNEQFYQAARGLRRRLESDVQALDIDRTLSGTIQQAGFPDLQYRHLTRPPEYLILIDLPAYRDHRARLFDTISGALEDEGLFVTRYFYEHDPRVCFREPGGPRVYLSDLKARYSDCRLIVFGSGDDFLDPLSGELDAWTGLFTAWQERAILTPVPGREWGRREIVLAGAFILLPASLEGLGALADFFHLPGEPDLKAWKQADTDAPAPLLTGEAEAGIDRLRDHLGEETFQWLCACAVYPELHWDLTLFLGSLPCMPEHLIDEENLLRLVRLPWFGRGTMPDELRWALIGELDLEKSRTIRAAIIDLLEKSPPPQDSFAYDTYRLHLVVERWMLSRKDRRLRRQMLKSLHTTGAGQITRDYILLRFLESVPRSPLHFILPRRLRKIFYHNGVPYLGFKTTVRLTLTLLLTAALFILFKPPPSIPPDGFIPPDPAIIHAAINDAVDTMKAKGFAVSKNEKGAWEADLGNGIQIVYISPGQFTMGSNDSYNDEKPPHEVYLDGYWLGKTEVTFDQYDKFCEETNRNKPSDEGWGRGKRPVINVSWHDVAAYCEWLSRKMDLKFKLPTEAQWEKAARGSDGRKYPWGNDPPLEDKANFIDKQFWLEYKYSWADQNIDDGYAYTAPVGSYKAGASPYGLLDMAGNVWEWCADWYDGGYYKNSPPKNPEGPSKGSYRVVRGGGWRNLAVYIRSAFRGLVTPSSRYFALGFRLCQEVR